MTDTEYMRIALELAENGCGFVNPNPLVGAVVVKKDQIIGRGFHEKYGGPHAERNALDNCTLTPEGATLYVTLEPCCHYGKTPPCTDAIIESGIKRVVVGTLDPNPVVAGKGIDILKRNGIVVDIGVLKDECAMMNEVFFHFINTGTPYVIMKYAMTSDGKIATYTGKSKWITGEQARNKVHHDRHRYSGIMVGVNTVLLDDPMLNCRIQGGKNPVRIICDTNLRTPLTSRIVRSANEIPTIIASSQTDPILIEPYIKEGCRVLFVPKKEAHIDIYKLMKLLGNEKIDSILLEGGATLNYSALKYGVVNKVQTYIAPKLFGGSTARTPVGGLGAESPEEAFVLSNSRITILGEDILIESEVLADVHRNN